MFLIRRKEYERGEVTLFLLGLTIAAGTQRMNPLSDFPKHKSQTLP